MDDEWLNEMCNVDIGISFKWSYICFTCMQWNVKLTPKIRDKMISLMGEWFKNKSWWVYLFWLFKPKCRLSQKSKAWLFHLGDVDYLCELG